LANQNKRFKSIIVTATWNRLDLLRQFLEALRRQEDQKFGVIIVDNGSEDGSREYLIEQAKNRSGEKIPIWVLLLKENMGFALPNNMGITFATEFLESDYIILLNNDTIPNPKFIKIFQQKADSYLHGFDQKNPEIDKKLFPFLSKKDDWKIGSFAPLVENYYAPSRVDAAGIKISPDGNAINRGVGEKVFKFKREKEVFGPSGSAVLYPKKALLDIALPPENTAALKGWEGKSSKSERIWSVGVRRKKQLRSDSGKLEAKNSNYQYLPIREFFSSRYFAYFEDVDLAWRLRLRYWGCVYLPEAKILHYHSATLKSYSPLKSFYIHRNQYFNIFRDFPSYWILIGFLNAIKRYFYLLQSLGKKCGPAAQVAQNAGKVNVFIITVKGWGSVIKNLFGLIRERYHIQSNRSITTAEFKSLINCSRFRATLEKMVFETPDFLLAEKKNGAGGRDHISQDI